MSLPNHYVVIDEEGYVVLSGQRVNDQELGLEILSRLSFAENGAIQTQTGTHTALVEAFDEPLVALSVEKSQQQWSLQLPYSYRQEFQLQTLSLDEWDRFHGQTATGIPFVFSRPAQQQFFQLLDDYDDDSIFADGKHLQIPAWLRSDVNVSEESFWTQIYQTETPGWEMNQPTPILVQALPQLKIPKSRVLVLGCGSGNDAAHFARQGHMVTAVDVSPEAIERAQKRYADLKQIRWLQQDIFTLSEEYRQQFDVIFEHTCYCAIDPHRRNDLVAIWKKCLVPGGMLIGVFFTMQKNFRPPFGGSEWEIRQRLKPSFQFLYWQRCRNSIDRRNGKELLVVARKNYET